MCVHHHDKKDASEYVSSASLAGPTGHGIPINYGLSPVTFSGHVESQELKFDDLVAGNHVQWRSEVLCDHAIDVSIVAVHQPPHLPVGDGPVALVCDHVELKLRDGLLCSHFGQALPVLLLDYSPSLLRRVEF